MDKQEPFEFTLLKKGISIDTFHNLMNGPSRLQTTITRDESGKNLGDWLSSRFSYHSTNEWAQRIRQGQILVNNSVADDSSYELHQGDVIEYLPDAADAAEPNVPHNHRIVYECDDYLIIDKPPGLPCHPAGRYRKNTLWNFLLESYDSLNFVNRLDRETSGLLILARTSAGLRHFTKLQGNGKIHKEYLVLVHGETPNQFDARGWISRDPESEIRKKQRFSVSFPDQAAAKSVSTIFTRIAGSDSYSLVKATLETGRTHQIRASLCSSGFPVVGDKIYGLDDGLFIKFCNDSLTPENLGTLVLSHQALHSAALKFSDIDGTEREFHAALPLEFSNLVESEFNLSLNSDAEVRRLWQ